MGHNFGLGQAEQHCKLAAHMATCLYPNEVPLKLINAVLGKIEQAKAFLSRLVAQTHYGWPSCTAVQVNCISVEVWTVNIF